MKIKVKVDDKMCIGSGNCVIIFSETFKLNKKGKSEVKLSKRSAKSSSEVVMEVNSEEKELLLEAARACPMQAISLMDEKDKPIQL